MIESCKKADDELLSQMLIDLANTKERLLSIASMIGAAEARLLAACHHTLADTDRLTYAKHSV